jgi:hypothetical protein
MSTEVQKVPLFPFYGEELSDYAKGFLEAAIDGEGCIMLVRSRRKDTSPFLWHWHYQPETRVNNNSKEWLELVAELAGDTTTEIGNVKRILKGMYYGNGFYYPMPRSIMKTVLPQLGLVIKERQRVLILEALDILGNRRPYISKRSYTTYYQDEIKLDEIRNKIKLLNKKNKGVPI